MTMMDGFMMSNMFGCIVAIRFGCVLTIRVDCMVTIKLISLSRYGIFLGLFSFLPIYIVVIY